MTKDLGLVPILLLTSTVMLVSDALWPVRRELWRRWRRVTSGDIWWHSPCVVELQQSSWTGTVYPIFSLVFLIVQGIWALEVHKLRVTRNWDRPVGPVSIFYKIRYKVIPLE